MKTILRSIVVGLVMIALAVMPVAAVDGPPQTGYVWWMNDAVDVAVYSDMHQEVPITSMDSPTATSPAKYPGGVFATWIKKGEACSAPYNSTYKLDSTVNRPTLKMYADVPGYDNTVGVVITSGRCKGFRGWVYHWAALHSGKRK